MEEDRSEETEASNKKSDCVSPLRDGTGCDWRMAGVWWTLVRGDADLSKIEADFPDYPHTDLLRAIQVNVAPSAGDGTHANAGRTHGCDRGSGAEHRWAARGVSLLDKTLKVWDVESGVVIAAFTGDSAVLCCAFATPHTIVAGDMGGKVHFLRFEE